MPVFLAILQILAVVLLLLCALILTALLLPLGFAIEYRPAKFRVSAVYGPWKRTIWSHRIRSGTPPRRAETPSGEEKGGRASAEQKEPAPPLPKILSKEESDPGAPETPGAGGSTIPVQESFPPDEEEEELPSGAMGRLERMLILMEEDPQTLGNCVLGHIRWLHRHSFFKMSIRHAEVFWTVTCEDAAATAIAYGAEMAALNTALALVQQTVRLQSDCLWLEPDFTGARRQDRRISCVVSASAVLMIHLLYRIWKDPLLQPAA